MHHTQRLNVGVLRKRFVTAFIVVYDQFIVLLRCLRLVWKWARLLLLNEILQDFLRKYLQLQSFIELDPSASNRKMPKRMLALQED